MARPNLKTALGREAVYEPAPPAKGAGRPPKVTGQRYDETHSRATYHLPNSLQEAVAAEAAKSGRPKSRVIADAIRQHLKIKE